MILASYLALGGIGAAIVGAWGHIKAVLARIRSLFIIRISLNYQLSKAMRFYIWRNFSRIRIGDRSYNQARMFVKPHDRYEWIPFELVGKSALMFFQGWRPLIVGRVSGHGSIDNSNTEDAYSGTSLTFLRGTFKPDDLIETAVREYNKYIRQGERSTRFYVYRRFGTLGEKSNMGQGSNDKDLVPNRTEDSGEGVSPAWFCDKRVIGLSLDDIGQRSNESNAVDYLAFPPHIHQAIESAYRWKKSKQWYQERHIPWKRGWLLYGDPGTGKTALARAVAQVMDMPVYVFNLATFTSREFQNAWTELKASAPCMALIEDIDASFDKRENIVRGGEFGQPLSFDTLLNTIDGIEDSSGIFLVITTNQLDKVDPALGGFNAKGHTVSRPGRVDRVIELPRLDENCRRQLAERILSDCPEKVEEAIKVGDDMTGAQFQDHCSEIALDCYWQK